MKKVKNAEEKKSRCPIPELPSEGEDVIAAKKLLARRGYVVIPYRRIWGWIKRGARVCWWHACTFMQGIRTWIGKKKAEHDAQAEIDRKREAERRAQHEKEALEERTRREAEDARRAEILRNEVRLAELKAEESRRQAAVRPRLVAESPATVSRPAAFASAERNEDWCSHCGAELVPGARFCRKCGKRVEPKPVPSPSVENPQPPRMEPGKSAVASNPPEVPNGSGGATEPQDPVTENPAEVVEESGADMRPKECS